jgi:multiple antibiotic resistance protein
MPTIQEIVTTFLAIFIVVDPFGIVPFFISLTAGFDARRRRATILKAGAIAFVVLLLFILAGNAILRFLGIQPGSFYIAGGILLFLVSIDLLFGKPGRTKTPPQEPGAVAPPQTERDDVSIFPLAVPMLAGPGTITTILLYVSAGRGAGEIGVLTACVAVALGCAMLTMSLSAAFLRVLGRTGVSVIERIMGIVLAGLSVQFVYDGIMRLGMRGSLP